MIARASLVGAFTVFGVLAPAQTLPAAPPGTEAPTANPAPTSPPSRPEGAAEPSSEPKEVLTAENEPTFQIYMPDSQLKSHSIRVYVTGDISPSQNPRLQLIRSHAVTKKEVDESKQLEPGIVAQGQEWIETVDKQEIRRSGTLLMFDISNLDFGYKAMLRVTPVVSWTEGAVPRLTVGAHEVYVANIVSTLWWTSSVVALALIIIILLARRAPLRLLTGANGRLSLAQTQIACWTLVVGGVVLGYGFIRLEIPDIPTSLLALMGASLATGGIGFFKDKQNLAGGDAKKDGPLKLGDLICVYAVDGTAELSLAKAQMLFWTLLLITLFVAKSILDGAIWAVPWELVALMGFSQTGYLAPKLAPSPVTGNVPEQGNDPAQADPLPSEV